MYGKTVLIVGKELAVVCYGPICFDTLTSSDPKFFGFAEFLSGLALMVLAWTIADVRYRFRLRTTPIPLQGITFFGMTALGVLTLATDLWRAEEWYVPVGGPLSPAIWQAILGFLFLLTFLSWAWFAFIRPPIYGKMNSHRFAIALYRAILNGSPEELTVVADELIRSVNRIIFYARPRRRKRDFDNSPPMKLKEVEENANAILSLISDPRFCRAVVSSSPATALAIFQDIEEMSGYSLPVETFAKNIVLEAMENKDSFLFHESQGYESGFLGYHKPLTRVMFGNFKMVESIRTLLDPNGVKMMTWNTEKWKAYCRVLLLALEAYITNGRHYEAYALHRATDHLASSLRDLYKINGLENVEWKSGPWGKLDAVVEFIRDAVELLDKYPVPDRLQLRNRKDARGPHLQTIYDCIAELMFEVVFAASYVTSPRWTCWSIQHNTVWTPLFGIGSSEGRARQVIDFKFRRLMYDEVKRMNDFINFKGARILAFSLNVMGLGFKKKDLHSNAALHRAILSWTKKHYSWLFSQNPEVAEACLVDGLSFDEPNSRLVLTYPADGLRREPKSYFFPVDPPQK
jgi:hypothetical protein